MERITRSLITTAALVTCSGAWAEIVSLRCNENPDGHQDHIYTIDLEKKVADWTMRSRTSGYTSRFPVRVLWVGPSVITLSNAEYKDAPMAYWEKKIDRVTLEMDSMTWDVKDNSAIGAGYTAQCEIIDTPKAKF